MQNLLSILLFLLAANLILFLAILFCWNLKDFFTKSKSPITWEEHIEKFSSNFVEGFAAGVIQIEKQVK